jgi:hypothetical protein
MHLLNLELKKFIQPIKSYSQKSDPTSRPCHVGTTRGIVLGLCKSIATMIIYMHIEFKPERLRRC